MQPTSTMNPPPEQHAMMMIVVLDAAWPTAGVGTIRSREGDRNGVGGGGEGKERER
jgi:hypothetical protein